MATWRDSAGPIISEVIHRVGRADMKKLRKELREAYPYGQRKHWPYKVWCDEVKRQLGHPIIAPRKDADQMEIW